MTRADLLALAARVEAAEGADYDIDRAITEAIGWPDGMGTPPAPYTSSLDAAASLVPPGWRWWVNSGACARAWLPAAPGMEPHSVAESPLCFTPALALTAAALRAMAEEAGDE